MPAATAAAIAKILNLVGIVISSKDAKERSTAPAFPFNGVKQQRVPGYTPISIIRAKNEQVIYRDWRDDAFDLNVDGGVATNDVVAYEFRCAASRRDGT